jgi:CBS domain-containing protein
VVNVDPVESPPPETLARIRRCAMSRRTVREVMTSQVVTVTENTPVKELAKVMAVHRVSALPVLDRFGRVTGLVGEADLLARQEVKEDPRAGRLSGRRRRRLRVKAAGGIARDVMTSSVPTISPDDSVVAAARLMHRTGTGHVLVTGASGQLAGIISRSDVTGVVAIEVAPWRRSRHLGIWCSVPRPPAWLG